MSKSCLKTIVDIVSLTATLLTHALTPAQLPPDEGGLLVVGGVLVVVFEVVVVVWLVVGGGVGALDPPCNAALTAASKRLFATVGGIRLGIEHASMYGEHIP